VVHGDFLHQLKLSQMNQL
jgi:hypothetical protein